MKREDSISPRQFVAMACAAILSPMIRRFPRTLAGSAGRAAWLAIPLAVLPLALAFLGAWLLFRRRPAGGGFAALLADALGKIPGKILTVLYALWLLFYAGFLLQSGASRLISTVYQGAGPWMFIICTAIISGIAAMGPVKALGRAAMLLRPLMAAMLILVFLLTVKDLDFSLLLPVTMDDLPSCGFAALKIVNLLGVAGYLAFLGDRVSGKFRVRDYAGWAAALLGVILLMTAACLGMFGPELTAKMTYPFFMLARDVTVLGALERIEPVAIMVWVFSDFLLISALLRIAARNLRFCFSGPEPPPSEKWMDFRQGRWLIPLCTALAAASAFLVPEDLPGYYRFSEQIIPLCSAIMVFVFPLLTLLVGKLRGKL